MKQKICDECGEVHLEDNQNVKEEMSIITRPVTTQENKPIYRVYTNEPTNWGDEKVSIKIFDNEQEARVYYNELLKEIKEDQKSTEDELYVVLEELTKDIHIDFAYASDEEE